MTAAAEQLRKEGPFRVSLLAGKEPPPRSWHLRDWIPGRTVTLLTGDGGAGKSTLALQLAVATATGRTFLGQAPRRGAVLYVAAEDDQDEQHRRFDEIGLALGMDLDELGDIHLWALADQDALLVTEGHGGQVQATERWTELMAAARTIQPALVVLDSLADMYGGNENDRAQVRQFVGLLRRLAMATDAAVLVLSHPSLSGMTSGTGSSGSTAWSNSVRSRIYFSRAGEGIDGDPDVRVLSLKKANYGRAQADMRVRRQVGGFVLDGDGGPADVLGARRKVDDLFLDLLTTYTAQGRRVSDATGAAYAPAQFAKDPSARGTSKAGMQAAMNRLFAQGAIAVETVGPASKQRRQLVRVDREAA